MYRAPNHGIGRCLRPVVVVVLQRNVVLRHLARLHFAFIRVRSVLHAAHNPRLKRLPFFQQLLGALRIRALYHGNSSVIACAAANSRRPRLRSHGGQRHRLYALASHHLVFANWSSWGYLLAFSRDLLLSAPRAQFCFCGNSAFAHPPLLAVLLILILLFHLRTPSRRPRL